MDERIPSLRVTFSEVDFFVLHPDEDEPGLRFFLNNGESMLQVFGDDAECDAVWEAIHAGLRNQNYVRYQRIIFRPHRLFDATQLWSEEFGYHMYFRFINGFEYREKYVGAEGLLQDWNTLMEIFGSIFKLEYRENTRRILQ